MDTETTITTGTETRSTHPAAMEARHQCVAAIKIGSTFSGYAYSFHDDFTQNPLKIGTSTTTWNLSGKYTTLKKPSVLLCKPDGTFHSFGYQAEDKYRTLGDEAEKWAYYKLCPSMALDNTSKMTDVTGVKERLASDVFRMAIEYLHKHLMDKLQSRIHKPQHMDITWLLISKCRNNEAFLQKAASEAGLTNDATVITKTTAAMTFVKCSMKYRGLPFNPGTKFIVFDATATSLELFICENQNGVVVQTTNVLQRYDKVGNTLNQGIKSLIETCLGVDDMSQHDDITLMMREIECKKRQIKPGSRQHVVVHLPERYKDAKHTIKRVVAKNIPGVYDDADFDTKVKVKDGKVHIDPEVIEGMFMTCAREAARTLQDTDLDGVCSVVMIGGYCQSLFLQTAVSQAFPHLRVYTLSESSIADLKGAVIYGHSKGKIETEDQRQFTPEKIVHYIKTLQDKTQKARNIRVIIVGQEGVGKSTLCYRLLDEKDDVIATIPSTDGVDIHIQRYYINMATKKRVKLAANKETENVEAKIKVLCNSEEDNTEGSCVDRVEGTCVKDVYIPAATPNIPIPSFLTEGDIITGATCGAGDAHSSGTPDLTFGFCEGYADYSVDRSDQSSESTLTTQTTKNTSPASPPSEFHDDAPTKPERSNEHTDDDCAYLSLWDFGGEVAYYNTHHIFLSSDAIYLIVYNLHDCIEETEEVISTAIRRIKYWVRSAVNHSVKCVGDKPLATPPVILVGTHLDLLAGTDEEIEQKLHRFEEKLCGMAEIQTMKDNIYGFLELSNRVHDHPGIHELWDAIIQVAPAQSQWDRQLPGRWLALEREIMRMKEAGEKVMTFEEVANLGRTTDAKISDETEIHMFLKYLHYTGSILYFGEDADDMSAILSKSIILDPQWIAHAFQKIITVPKFMNRKDKRLNFLWKLYQKSAILEMKYLQIVWSRDEIECFWKFKDTILAFMERLGLIARLKPEEKNISYVQTGTGNDETKEETTSEVYLVPSMLSGQLIGLPREMTDKHAVKTRTLCFVFENKCVPDPVFDRFLAACIEKFQVLKADDEIWLRRGFGIFKLDSVWFVVIYCRSPIIKVTLYKQSPYPNIEPGAGLRVRLFVEDSLRKIVELYDYKDLKFTYHLHCKTTEEEGDTLVSKTELELRRRLPCCQSSRDQTHFIHKHELQPWFSDERPPVQDELDEEYNLTSEVLEKCPSELELMRMSKLLGSEAFEFFIRLGLKSVVISQVIMQYQHESTATKFLHMFCRWRNEEGEGKATIRRIMDAMKAAELDVSEVSRKGVFDTVHRPS